MLAYCVKDGKHEDAEEFLALYLDALDEELVELHTYLITQFREESESVEGQTEVGKLSCTVCRILFLSLH